MKYIRFGGHVLGDEAEQVPAQQYSEEDVRAALFAHYCPAVGQTLKDLVGRRSEEYLTKRLHEYNVGVELLKYADLVFARAGERVPGAASPRVTTGTYEYAVLVRKS